MDGNGRWAAITFLAALVLFLLFARYAMRGPVSTETSLAPVIVDVRGEVREPGVHMIERPSVTVGDALEAAGCEVRQASVSMGAIHSLLNRPIHTGESIFVMRGPGDKLSIEIRQMEAAARITLGLKLDLNEATEDDLRLIPQMKPEIASAIVERRKRKQWRSVDDLVDITGVGPKTAKRFKEYLVVPPKG